MKPEYKIGDDVYVSREILYDSKIYTIYNIDEETGTHTIVQKGGLWNYNEGCFELWDGEVVPMRHLKYEELFSIESGLDFLIDRFSFLINRHVAKTTSPNKYKSERDDIIKRISKKLHDNR